MDDLEILADAAAFLIADAHNRGCDDSLGKTKLYKMLFLASWRTYQDSGKPLFNGPGYRIERGPALYTTLWQALKRVMKEKYGISAERVVMWHGYPQESFSKPDDEPRQINELHISHLEKAFDEIIGLTADEAAKMTYETKPMQWLVAQERAEFGGTTQFRVFKLTDTDRDRFIFLAEKYVNGKLEIQDIASEMGADWSLHKVAIFLDTLGYFREPEDARLQSAERERILNGLVEVVRGKKRLRESSIEERVMASSRIEEDYFAPESIID